nr:O-acyltransferase like protein-like [Leptinotarsa decemlineata]
MIGFGCTIWIVSMFYGPIKDLYSDLEYQRCQKNWWTSVLFINNHYNQYDMCHFITWYLSADTQLYVLSLIILSIIWMFKRNTVTILGSCVVVGILIPTMISYIYDLDFIYRITPENSKNNKFRSFNFNAIYSSNYANMATYMVGLCFGYVYSKMKNGHFFVNTSSKIICWLAFLGLPVSVVLASSHYYSRFVSAILSGILKPLYAVGIAVGILGMSQGIGGIVKRICEWKPALILGNLTYSTYVVHYGIVFYRTATAKQPLYISDSVLITSFIYDAIFSFSCGFLMHILVEMPASQLQNKYVPQVRKQRGLDKNNKEK